MDYYRKYLLYKMKYINLKNQIAGSEHATFDYSINFPNEYNENYIGDMFDKISEFEHETKKEFKNNKKRLVNKIEMSQNSNIINYIRETNKKFSKLLTPEINEYIMKPDWQNFLIYISRFYNSSHKYNEDMDNGVIVDSSTFNKVFNDSFIKSERFRENISNNVDYNATYRKGFGSDNFVCTLEEIKKYKPELKVLYLHANGDQNLVKYYQSIGFSILIEEKIPKTNSTGRVIALYQYIMFGLYDDIITNLKSKLRSKCDNLLEI